MRSVNWCHVGVQVVIRKSFGKLLSSEGKEKYIYTYTHVHSTGIASPSGLPQGQNIYFHLL